MVPVLRILALLAASFALWAGPGAAQSALLESVKANPARAKALCAQLRQLNAQGVASNSPRLCRWWRGSKIFRPWMPRCSPPMWWVCTALMCAETALTCAKSS